jgi:hypothetical protein
MDMMINEILMKLNDEEQKYIFNLKNKNDTAINYRKIFYENNKEKIKEYSRQYYLKNREKKKTEMLIRYYKNKTEK